MIRSCICIKSAALVTEMPGKVVGIYKSVPSLSAGMNSVPSWRAGQSVAASTATASRMTKILARSTALMIGR